MRNLYSAYRVLAPVVGVLLTVLSFVVLPMKYLLDEGSSLQKLGVDLSIGWSVHGFVYIVYVLVVLAIASRARWSVTFLVLVLVAGLVPLLIFWVERQVAARLRAQFPELDPAVVQPGA